MSVVEVVVPEHPLQVVGLGDGRCPPATRPLYLPRMNTTIVPSSALARTCPLRSIAFGSVAMPVQPIHGSRQIIVPHDLGVHDCHGGQDVRRRPMGTRVFFVAVEP